MNLSSIRGIDEVAIGDLQRARKLTGIDFTMVFLHDLPVGISVENYAAELFSRWKIGADAGRKGVLFLFVESAGVLKIEVGYELEGVFPDGFVGSFQDSLKHYFAGRYFGDVVSGMITAMVRRAQNESEDAALAEFESNLAAAKAAYQSGGAGTKESGFSHEADAKKKLIRALDEGTRKQYAAAGDPDEVIRRYVDSLAKGYDDPYVGLLTEGSQYMRLEYPKSEGFQRNSAREFSGEYDLNIRGNLAAARFRRPDVMPLLLRKGNDGLWRIDVTKSWAFSQASSDLKVMKPAFGDHPWMYAWPDDEYSPEYPPTPTLLPADLDLAGEIARLEGLIEKEPNQAKHYFALADLLYFECYWIRSAMDTLEKGLALDPSNSAYRRRLIAFSYRFPDLSRLDYHYKQLLLQDPNDFRAIQQYRSFLKNYRNDPDQLAALKKQNINLGLTTTPYCLYTKAAQKHPYDFLIPPDVRELEVEFRQFYHAWHDKWVPAVQIVLSDLEQERFFGFEMNALSNKGASEVSLADSEGIGKRLALASGSEIGFRESHRVRLRWNDRREVTVELDGQAIGQGSLPFEPAKLITMTRSAGTEFSMRWTGSSTKVTSSNGK